MGDRKIETMVTTAESQHSDGLAEMIFVAVVVVLFFFLLKNNHVLLARE